MSDDVTEDSGAQEAPPAPTTEAPAPAPEAAGGADRAAGEAPDGAAPSAESDQTAASGGAQTAEAEPEAPKAAAADAPSSEAAELASQAAEADNGDDAETAQPADAEEDTLPVGGLYFAGDAVPHGYFKAGTEELWVAAKGAFEEKALRGYAPSPESTELHIGLNNFDGPLDLLLHLIRQHAMDILDIPIAAITARYLGVLDDMRHLNLDVAGEFLVMAAQLAHIKSKMLLPKDEKEEEEVEEEDPRLALVRRLLEYQRFQEAAKWLEERDWLGRDIFTRPEGARAFNPDAMPSPDDPTYGLVQLEPIKLIKLLDVILKRNKKKIVHEVVLERLNVGQRINELVDLAKERESFTLFDAVEAFGGLAAGKGNIIVTFLAILEMTKFKLLRIHQAAEDGTIYISPVQENLAESDIAIEGYADEAPQGLPA